MILDESTPIWGPDGESLLTLAVRDSRLLPIGRVIRRSAEVPTDPDAKIQAMIALRITPEVASQYGAGPSAAGQAQVLPLEERHITLAYLGEIDGLERRRAHDFTRRWLTDSDWPTMEGRAQGWGTFIPPADSDDAKTVLWMSWDIPGLSEMRQNLIDELQANGFDLPSEHDFTPHETVAYYDTLPSRLPPFPESNPSQTFGSVVVGEDDTWTEYDFPMRMALRDGATISLTAALAAADGSWETIPGGEALVAAGGWDRNRGNAEALRRFWTVGRGGAKIRWNTPGDYSRCVRYLSKHLGPRAKGYCALRHREMTRLYTGDMKHRILYGWGGKPGSYWAKVAAHEILDDPVESADFWVPSNHTAVTMALTPMAGEAPMNDATNPLVMLLGGEPAAPVGFRIPLLLPEGVESGDGRTFKKGITEIRELPIPLLWQPSSMSGHDGAAIVGRIDSVERLDDGLGDAVGVFDTSPLAMEAVRMIRAGMLRGVSADLDQFEAKIKGKGPGTTEAKEKGKDDNTITPEKMDITKGRVMAATLVAKPAFEQCRIELIEAEPIPDGEYAHELTPDETELAALFAEFMEREAMATFSIVAAGSTAAPIYPPSSWFTDPGLSRPTHLTITDDGRVFGHIAAWHVDHIGMGFGTRPPRSRSNYSYFRTGIIRTEEGTDIRVGQLTLIGGHASLSADAREAVKHYDDTASAFADVAAGEDGHGIWVAGALRPTVTPEQVRIARASSPSGDWRPINGALELVAVCQVNVPGFPVVEARVASGRVLALVAAGVSPLLIERMASPEGLAVLADRARARIEAPLRQQALVASATIAHARMFSRQPVSAERRKADVGKGYAMPGGRYPIEDLADLKRAIRAYGRATEEDKPKVRKHIAKRARALGHPELIPEDWKNLSDSEVTLDAESLEESLFKDYSTERRAEMEKEGAAMKGGRYPISNIADLKRAIHAYGRGDPKDKPAIRRHIAKRARALGHPELIPESWKNLSDSEVTLTVEPPEGAEFKDYSTESRKGMAKAGIALPDGSYPIKSVADLKNAIHAYGRAAEKDRAKVRRHIAKRARALGHPELIPEDWKGLTAGAMSRFRLEECVTNNWAMPDGRYPITCAVDLQRAVADYAIADIPDRTPVRRHLIRRAKELGCPDLLPSAWDIETAMVTNLPIGLVASLRSVRSEQWDESKVARNEIGRFRKIYYRLRNSPDAAKPEMRAALRAIREAGVTAQEQGATDADTARLAREALKEAAVSAQIDERTQVEVIEAAQDVSNMMRRFEVRGPETKMSFSQLPTDIQNAIERYLKQPNLEERITKHFGPFVEGKATRSIKDIVNFIERVVIDAHDYRKGRATEGMVSPERNT